jgi:hypothetical protein
MAMLQKASASLQCVSRSRSTSVRVSAAKQGEWGVEWARWGPAAAHPDRGQSQGGGAHPLQLN